VADLPPSDELYHFYEEKGRTDELILTVKVEKMKAMATAEGHYSTLEIEVMVLSVARRYDLLTKFDSQVSDEGSLVELTRLSLESWEES
jgi:hypothetical protein